MPRTAARSPTATPNGPLIAVPLYRAPELVAPLVAALGMIEEELAALDASLLFINDSPDDEALGAALRDIDTTFGAVPASVRTNAANLGFVRTANIALALALDADRDVILLNSDALPTPGAFAEMMAVARASPAISVVSPRSNNATICNSPYPDAFRALSGDAALAAHRAIAPYLPRFSYVPTAVGFCLLVRVAMIRAFGLFDEVYGGGYNEENDFIRRCNRDGYRAALANRAFVHHVGSVSFAASATGRDRREIANRAILDNRYPDYGPLILRYFAGAEYRAQAVLAGLVPDGTGTLRLLIDCRGASDADFPLANELIAELAVATSDRFELLRIGEHPALAAPTVPTVTEYDLAARPCAAAIAIGLPGTPAGLIALMAAAPVTAAFIGNGTSFDRRQADNADSRSTWELAASVVTLCGFAEDEERRSASHHLRMPAHVFVAKRGERGTALAKAIDAAIAQFDFRDLRSRLNWVALLADRETMSAGQDAIMASAALPPSLDPQPTLAPEPAKPPMTRPPFLARLRTRLFRTRTRRPGA